MATGYPQLDGQGQLLRAIVVFVDVTTQRQTEQLRVAKEAAEAASRAKSAFLSRVSHELRTPLNAIIGFSDLLLGDERLEAGAKDKLRHVLSAGWHLLRLIEQIMDLSRLESGQVLPQMRPVALWPLLEECVGMFAPLALARRVTVELRSNGPGEQADAWVQGDATWLRQVLMNLVSNALKYNHEGGQVSLELQVHAEAAPGAWPVRVDVLDNGPGLSASQQAGLFQPFNRLGAERSGVEGNRLGLLISRQLAQAMGGDITVVSTPGQGSCFSLHLQRGAVAEPSAAARG
jgi:signal transduction histidine kinase